MSTPLRDPSQTRRSGAFLPLIGLLTSAWGTAVWGQAASPEAQRNWPQWRGPLATGVSPTAQPPLTWSETSNVKWKVKLPGSGSGTPIVWNDRIYIQAAVQVGGPAAPPAAGTPQDMAGAQPGRGGRGGPRSFQPTETYRFVLLCLDRATGKPVWQAVSREEVPHEGHHQDHGFASYSPVTDGKSVFAFFGSRGLYCYDMQGKPKWSKDLGRMQTKMGFGEGSSPALSGDTLVVNWDHEGDDFIVALNAATGDERWRQPREEDTTWSTPLIVEHEGKKQVITAGTRKVRSYDLATGRLIWEASGLTANVIPTPVAGNGMVYLTSGFRGNALMAIRLGRTGDLTGTDAVAWTHNRSTPYVPSPLLYGDRLYFFGSNSGILSCFNAKSGQPLINAERIEALQGVYASPVGAAGRVYLVGRNGATVVLKHSDALEVLATNRLEERIDASPAVAGKELFLRGHEYLYCIAEK